MTRVVAFANNKGGTGKTSTVVQLAAALAGRGDRVLVVDLDPQANASRRLGVRFDSEHPVVTISEVIKADTVGVAADAVRPCGWDHALAAQVDLIPSRFDLEARVSEGGVVGAVRRLRKALDGVTTAYDWVLIDLPPSLGHLTQMGLVAADAVVLVTEPEYDSVEGAVRVRDFIQAHREDLGVPRLTLAGVIVSRVRNLGGHTYQLQGLPEYFGDSVWAPYIPERAVVKDASDAGVPLAAIHSPVARQVEAAFSQLAECLRTATA